MIENFTGLYSFTQQPNACVDLPNRKMDFVYRFLRHLSTAQPIDTSLMPQRTIHYIANNCLAELIKSALDSLFPNQYFDKRGKPLITSCVNSVCGISSVLLGPLKTKQMFNLINIQPQYGFPVKLPSGNVIELRTRLLFAGNATQQISLDSEYPTLSPSEKSKRAYDYALPHLNLFRNHLQSFVDKIDVTATLSDIEITKKLHISLSKCDFKFNLSVINALREEIRSNSNKTNSTTSFLYFLNTSIPHIKENEIQSMVEHAIVLEQFFSSKDKSIRIRRYQSWIHTASLLDDIYKHKHNETGEGSWNFQQTDSFLNSLEDHYCSDTGYLEKDKAIACFGYCNDFKQKYPLVISHQNTISGINLRYIVNKFNPVDCLDHLRTMAL